MKVKKCPYCGKRISYFTIFNEKKQGEHICRRCGKESKIIISRKIFIYFLIAVVISAVIITVWIGLGFINNPIGIILVAIPLLIFYFIAPKFEKVYPLKKYKKSMEAAKAAREYGGEMKFKQNLGNNIKREESNISTPVLETQDDFSINENVFSSIKSNRKKPVLSGSKPDTDSQVTVFSEETEEKYVPIIEKNKVSHISSSENVPLQKIHKEKPVYTEIKEENNSIKYKDKENKKEKSTEKRKKYEGSKYSANRKF